MAKGRYEITNWNVTDLNALPVLEGEIDGRRAKSGPIKRVAGRTVFTEKCVYRLVGDPNPNFTKLLEEKKLRVLKSAPMRPLAEAGLIRFRP